MLNNDATPDDMDRGEVRPIEEDRLMDEFPEVPLTAIELAARWLARDELYASEVRMPLGEDAVKVIRFQRMMECMTLVDPRERGRMWRKAKTWEQPKHQDFGSLRDWLDD